VIAKENLDEPLVDDLLTSAELALRRELRAVVGASVAPHAAAADVTGSFAAPGFRSVARYCGLVFPRAYGGLEASTVSYVVAVEEIARACASTSLIWATQTHAGYPILLAGSEEQRRRYLPRICDGSIYASLAVTESEAGSDAASLRTRARRDGDTYVIDGAKTFITTGDRADVVICFATLDPRRGRDGITAFLVPGAADGLDRGGEIRKLGMNGSTTAQLFFDGVRVPASARLGGEGKAWELVVKSVVKSRISAAAQGLGIAAASYAAAIRSVAERGWLTGSSHQAAQFQLADLRTRIQVARLHLHSVARAMDAGQRDLTADVAMAKVTCTDLGFAAASQAVDLIGMDAQVCGSAAERLVRDVKVTQIYDGTNEIQRLLVARDLAAGVAAVRG
jgi:alkylation response protein AidB-like acyl-CoA dehydrogenase